jgi:hypothetical protein
MRRIKKKIIRRGSVLIVVLFIVMAITILSLGFLTKSNVELACGENMIIKAEMDYLAESGLEHAKGLILNPQDFSTGYWTGAASQQMSAGSDCYYDVNVVKTGEYNYQVDCLAYKQKAGERIARSSLEAELRLNPCIAYYQQNKKEIWSQITINGDAYFCDDVTVYGKIKGDVYSAKSVYVSLPGSIDGQDYSLYSGSAISAPAISYSNFSSSYYIGSTSYSVQQIASGEYVNLQLGPSLSNPAGVYYCNGNIDLRGTVQINGMLVVKDDMKIRDGAVVTINSVRNFPALLVGYDLSFEEDNGRLDVTGFTKIENHIDMKNKLGCVLNIWGSLYIMGDGIINTANTLITITAKQEQGAIEFWPAAGTAIRWSPAAGAFYKSIKRQ